MIGTARTTDRSTPEIQLLDLIARRAGIGPVVRQSLLSSRSGYQVVGVRTKSGAYVMRLARASRRPDGTLIGSYSRWARLLRQIERLEIAPICLSNGTVGLQTARWAYLACSWIPGKSFEHDRDLAPLTTTLSTLHLGTIGAQLPLTHATDLKRFIGRQLRRDLLHIRKKSPTANLLRVRSQIALAALRSIPPRAGGPVCLVHNDLVGRNIVTGGRRVWFIDWEWAMISRPAIDLCCFLSPFVTSWEHEQFLSCQQVRRFLSRYLSTWSRGEARRIVSGMSRIWQPYNALLANWTFRESPIREGRSRSERFFRRAFRAADAISPVLSGIERNV
ncbi:MAG: aminoglycoside phosphotransferase family protein [candidate division Zixibacteria bacterium]|nr:aminoglycoside phosphotransferase family protein [candidate division Zixibacteria bacterium]